MQAQRSKESQESTRSRKVRNIMDQVATHLPDQVVNVDHSKALPYQVTIQGVLLFLDISGFTSLTEKYSMNAKNGTDQLTKTLNGYMHALVNEILTNDGDILQFAGDAILCLWEVGSFMKMKATVCHCMRTAKSLQDNVGEYLTGAGIKLRVKVGLAAGEVMITFLGNNENCHLVTMGRAVTSVNEAESWCVPGDITISPSAWCHCSGIPVEVEKCDDDKHVKLLSIDHDACEKMNDFSYHFLRTDKIEQEQAEELGIIERAVRRRSSLLGEYDRKKQKKHSLEASVMRRAVARQFDRRTSARLRLYVATPVLRKLDDGQPLEYLSEMRQVSICFINLVLEVCTKYEETVTLQSLFNVIYKEISSSQGCLNKVFMFDKGCTFLAIFGLPGFKHENDCARALQCSEKIAIECNVIPKVLKTSIGVTTGSSYCGVMGHTLRHEYTVIGRKVNMAARLMMHYPGKVTCDNETYHHAKLNKANFTTLELKAMKGLQNVGTIREYKKNKDRVGTMAFLKQQEMEFPLIGRDIEMGTFMDTMRVFKENVEDVEDGPQVTKANCFRENVEVGPQTVVLKGEGGVGKSRVLDAMVVRAMGDGVRVVMINLHMVDMHSPYYAIKHLLIELLDLDMESPHTERETQLLARLSDNDIVVHDLALLNDLLHMKLRLSQRQQEMTVEERKTALHNLMYQIVELMVKHEKYLIFCADDAHYMDRESWEFIGDLGKSSRSLVLLSLKTTSKNFKHPEALSILQKTSTVFISLDGLEPQYIGALACQLLAVKRIPTRLDDILRKRSHGLPSWCEQLLYSLLYDGCLNIEHWDPDEEYPEELMAPDPKYLVRKIICDNNDDEHTEVPLDQSTSARLSMPANTAYVGATAALTGSDDLVCLFKEGFVMTDVRLPDSIKGMVQARIDGLAEIDQMLVKTAAVLGLRFPRQMLDRLLDRNSSTQKVNEALSRLAKNGIILCGSTDDEAGPQVEVPSINLEKRLSIVEKKFVFNCHCAQNKRDKFKVDYCELLQFQTATIQETAYEMSMENLRRSLHVKAANYMEAQPHKCPNCGGSENILLSAQENPITYTETPLRESTTNSSLRSGHGSAAALPSALARVRKLSYKASIAPASQGPLLSPAGQSSLLSPSGIVPQKSSRIEPITEGQALLIAPGPSRRQSLSSESTPDVFHSDRLAREMRQSLIDDEMDQNLDLRDCTCTEIMTRVYPELIRHWRCAGNVGKTVHAILEAASALLSIDDNLQALAFLTDLCHMIEAIKKDENPFAMEHINQVDDYQHNIWIEGKMHSLTGQALYHFGRVDESISHFHTALKILGNSQPETKAATDLKIFSEGLKQWKHHVWPRKFFGRTDDTVGSLVEQARCLSHIFHEHQSKRNKREALMTVLQQINLVEEADSDVHELILAYNCMMECCQVLNWPRMGARYEEKAQLQCINCSSLHSKDSLITIGHFYLTSLVMRLGWGRIDDAIEAGYTGDKILEKVHENDLRCCLLPYLCTTMMLAGRTCTAIEALEQLEFITNETADMTGKTWYYACCMDFILETSIQMAPFSKILKHAQDAKNDSVFERNHLPLFYLSSCLALWYQRYGATHKRLLWQEVAERTVPFNMRSPLAMHAHMKLLEVKLLEFSRFQSENNQKKIRTSRNEIEADFACVTEASMYLYFLRPRLLHFQAYHSMVRNERKKAMKLLNQSNKIGKKQRNCLECNWIVNNRQAWTDKDIDKMPKTKTIWTADLVAIEDDEENFLLDYHEAKKTTTSFFKLPMPRAVVKMKRK